MVCRKKSLSLVISAFYKGQVFARKKVEAKVENQSVLAGKVFLYMDCRNHGGCRRDHDLPI